MLPPGEKPLAAPQDGPVVTPEDRLPPRDKRPLLVRLLPLLIVVVALGGFGGIVGYYYFASSAGGVDGVAPLIRADQRPVRVRPENPGGMDVPHQDKEIYDKVAGRSAPAPAAERLLPPPETPLPRPAPPAASTALPPAPPAAAPVAPPSVLGSGPVAPGTLAAAPPRPPGTPAPPQPNVPPPPDVTPPTDVTSQRTIPPPPPGSTALPGATRPAAPAAAPPPAPAPAVAAAAPRVAGGSRVVLASVQSEADAQREWDRLRRQYGAALDGLTPEFVRTDLGARGIFWRIYVGPVESGPEAQARCAALKQRQVNCFVARP